MSQVSSQLLGLALVSWAFARIGVHRPSLRLPYLMFSIRSYLPLDFNRVSSLQPTYRHPFGRPFTYLLFRLVSRLGTGSGTRCFGPRGGTAVRMEQKTRSKFLPWPGYNLGPWHLAAAKFATRLPRTPPFSRLLRHAGGYSRTILTPNLQRLYNTCINKCKTGCYTPKVAIHL